MSNPCEIDTCDSCPEGSMPPKVPLPGGEGSAEIKRFSNDFARLWANSPPVGALTRPLSSLGDYFTARRHNRV